MDSQIYFICVCVCIYMYMYGGASESSQFIEIQKTEKLLVPKRMVDISWVTSSCQSTTQAEK